MPNSYSPGIKWRGRHIPAVRTTAHAAYRQHVLRQDWGGWHTVVAHQRLDHVDVGHALCEVDLSHCDNVVACHGCHCVMRWRVELANNGRRGDRGNAARYYARNGLDDLQLPSVCGTHEDGHLARGDGVHEAVAYDTQYVLYAGNPATEWGSAPILSSYSWRYNTGLRMATILKPVPTSIGISLYLSANFRTEIEQDENRSSR
ncbi:hypothetical protein B0H10DRAFT_2339430 [Mycena sp. CBHHK59/15]|nr:hypothetical protein B0H10DRAFT_2339430 [Mycena sp. CBHHK59/15]